MKSLKKTIKQMDDDQRPREKLHHQGKQSLTDKELVAILINTGYKGVTALDMAEELLHEYGHNLHELSKIEYQKLAHRKGFGPAKASRLIAALELSNRREMAVIKTKPSVKNSKDAYLLLKPRLNYLRHEEFWVLMLNRKNKVLRSQKISEGGWANVLVDARKVFKLALDYYAHQLIIAHNHPSDEIDPSRADMQLTEKLVKLGEMLNIPIIDHIIVGNRSYYSFADEGRI